ncbi:NAD(P)/FAD-dependent oxidoreductase [Amycolatopsis sp. GM8]|uniref:NAD(P)/FAD-dependent oxidoreductase n=1 Tax=Amycolatopsis sp. GM8 TaxID=2896530 RepID=UPI001F26A64B|nr:FAD-dependent oxidoreductase [Amycolatopsis sp. GM8]
MTMSRCVIVGGGPAAASAAGALRAAGFDGSVTIVSAEDVPPYERPPLSKDFLTGATGAGELQLHPRDWYTDLGVDLRLGTRVAAVDTAAHALVLTGGERIGYDSALIATGGTARRLPGVDHDRVRYLRDLADAGALAKRLATGEPVIVLGGGFIGCEVAASARKLGVDVTMLEMADHPLQRVVGDEVGRIVAGIHRDHGVKLRMGETVQSVHAGDDGVLVTTDRGRLEGATLVVAIGLVPSTGLVARGEVALDDVNGGIVVDGYCRTSAPEVYAAGDVASHEHPRYGRRIRVEHHDNAIRQAAVAARNMLGAQELYEDPHWFWSDQYEHSLQAIGRGDDCDRTVVRGSPADRRFSVFSLSGGRVRGVFALDRGADILAGKRLIRSAALVTPEQLADESVNLKRLAVDRSHR